MKFKIGDKVVAINGYGNVKKGMTGVVRMLRSNPPVGVEWNGFTSGHDLRGTVSNNSGYFMYEKDIRLDFDPNDLCSGGGK